MRTAEVEFFGGIRKMSHQDDKILLEYINRAINTGATLIHIPHHLILVASEEALETARQLLKLAGVEAEIIAN